jgi:predicted HTH transcriptional regulator
MTKNQPPSTDQGYIKKLITEGEHQQLDFKFEISDSRKIARTLVAFANTDGGRLLVGVKDNGVIAGVRSDEEYFMVEAAANMYCKPPILFKVKNWNVDTRTVFEVIIRKSEIPVFAQNEKGKWMAYVRVGDQNILANRVVLEVWKRKNKPHGTYIKYSKSENELLAYLAENEEITISKFTRISRLTQLQAENIMINLICLGIIEMRLTEKGAYFKLKK